MTTQPELGTKTKHSGQIIVTSHDRFPPNGGDCKGNPRLFQGNLGEGEIL